MQKYDGMNRVDTKVRPSPKIKKHKKASFFKQLVVQVLVVGVLALALFSGKFFAVPYYQKMTDAIKIAVGYDVIEVLREKLPS